ncbi:DUF7832 domain-containing protein [Lacrimispora brassicae]
MENDFLSKTVFDDYAEEVKNVKIGNLNCRDFFMQMMDGVFTSEELNTKGQKFANAYYKSNKTKFAKQFGWYLSDYDELTFNYIKEPYTRDNWYFFFENSEENYLLVKAVIDERYREFLS